MAISPTQIFDWDIYKITSPSNRVYIGLTSNLKQRVYNYKMCYCKHQKMLFFSIKKYGFDNHLIETIDTFKSDAKYAYGKEIFWIKSYMTNRHKFPEQNGLNLTNGGDGIHGYKHTAETIEKNRRSRIGKKASEETKKKMSVARRGKKRNVFYTEAQREALRERGRRLVHTEESKRKIGLASKGNQYGKGHIKSQEQIENHRKLMMGNKYGKGPSEKNKKAIRESLYKTRKPIFQIDTEGTVIREFVGVAEAQRILNVNNISGVLTGKLKHSGGFIFKYK